DGGEATLGSDHRSLKVVELEPALPGTGFLDAQIQNALTAAFSRTQLRIHMLDAGILLQELEPLLERSEGQRCPGSAFDSIPQVPGAKPLIAFDVDSGEGALNNLNGDRACHHVLIRNNGAGGDVASIHIEQRQCETKSLQILGCEYAVLERGGYF